MDFLKRLLRLIVLCMMMALLLAAVPLVVSAERQAQPASRSPAREIAQPKPQAAAAETAAQPAAAVQRFASVPAVPAVPSSRAAGAVQAPAQPVGAQPVVVASLPQDAPAAAIYDVESVPMRRGKWIEIILDEQRLIAWEDGRMVMTTLVSTGAQDTPTIRGVFRIYRKLDAQRMRGRDYDLPDVPYVMYFKGSYAMHGTYWHNNFGRPMSHGCVNIPTGKAAWLYEWAPRGTVVVVR
ncbi:MAG: hypothetical protein KatS3mg053_1205 [Candidatus Roseilinea sp.]|nr:MAG: hypothetical protein KatS3mg053_1205 [Candidatus Roseilinea sp.]